MFSINHYSISPHFSRYTTSPKPITIPLPEDPDDLNEKVLFIFHRHIEKLYQRSPLPKHYKNGLIITEVAGGKGDIAAAAKAIALIQRTCPQITSFDWVISQVPQHVNPLSFLTSTEASKVHHRGYSSLPVATDPADFCLIGPIIGLDKEYIATRSGRKITGPIYGFKEIAKGRSHPQPRDFELFQLIFNRKLYLPMGIIPGSGVFLDQDRINSPLSRGYCCPSYLHRIQDAKLRKDILESMQVYDDKTTPDFDRYSFNSGYAHASQSWGRFIDAVAIHECDKHVVIVLNQDGECDHLSAEKFCSEVFTPERIDLLQKKEYGSLTLKAEESETALLLTEDAQDKRNFTVIIRPAFTPQDMKQLQLASERLIATGDNTAIESWCARCKLYLYECFPHKLNFLKQQKDLAKKIAPSMRRLLDVPDSARIAVLEKALQDPDLEKDTLNFCQYIIEHCSFDPLFEGGFKRAAWQHTIPDLMKIEEETIDKEFQRDLIQYIKDPLSVTSLAISTLPQLEERIQKRVQQYRTASIDFYS